MTGTRHLAPVTAASALTALWLAALGLITTPYLLDRLGPSQYAVFALITIIGAYLANLEFGFGHATVRFLAQARARGDSHSERRIIGTSLVVFLACALLGAALVLAGASFVVDSFAHFPPSLEDEAVGAIRLGALVIGLTFLSSFSGAALQALGRFRVLVGSKLGFGTLSSVSAIVAAAVVADARAVVAAQLAVAVGLCGTLLLSLRRASGRPLRPRLDRPTLRAMGGFSLFVLAAGLAYQVMIQGPPTVLAGEVPSDELAAFAVPALVLQQLTLLVTSASLSFLPFASAESAGRDRARLAAVFSSHVRLTLAVMGPIAGFLIVFANPLLSAWVGSAFAATASAPLQLLAAAALVLALSAPPADVARGMGRPGWVFAYTLAGAVGGLVVTLLAVGSHGPSGAALGLLAGLLLATTPFLLIVADRLLGQTPTSLLRAVASPAVAVLLVTGLYWLGSLAMANLAGAGLAGALLTPAYAIATYRIVLDDTERRTLAAGGQMFLSSLRSVRRSSG